MKDFQKELDKIEIPLSLHERARNGILQAEQERKQEASKIPRKKKAWLPTILAIPLTATAGCFLWFAGQMNTPNSSLQTSAPSEIETAANPLWQPDVYGMAMIAIILIIAGAIFMRKKYKTPIFITSGVTLIFISVVVNGAYFQVHQLEDPILLPSYYEVREGMDQTYLEINYVTNKQEQYTLEYISFNDFSIFNENMQYQYNFVESLVDYAPDIITELTHHYVKKAIFQLSQEEWGYLLDHPEEVANAKAYFVWPQTNVEGKDIRTPISLQLVDKRDQSEMDLDGQSGGGSSAGDFYENVILNETVTFDALHVPPGMEGIEIKFYTTKDNDSTKNKEEDMDVLSSENSNMVEVQLPFTVERGKRLQILGKHAENGYGFTKYRAEITLSGPDGLLLIREYWEPSLVERDIITLRKERGLND